MRLNGKIATWKDDRGYGFIEPDNGGPQVFVHIKSFLNKRIRPAVKDPVSFELAQDSVGRPQAKYVKFEGVGTQVRAVDKSQMPLLATAALFPVLVGGLALAGYVPPAVPGLYFGASLMAYLFYRVDKSAARDGRWRTRESTLHLLGLVGGWPGALVAQRLHRHKSSKPSFQLVFWTTVLVNIGALAWIMTPQGLRVLQNALEQFTRLN
jgi:uncharacterized membrane protein YsdA (DUF1294 family)/cold shock CspA family protein